MQAQKHRFWYIIIHKHVPGHQCNMIDLKRSLFNDESSLVWIVHSIFLTDVLADTFNLSLLKYAILIISMHFRPTMINQNLECIKYGNIDANLIEFITY